jgi:hypothetical protein
MLSIALPEFAVVLILHAADSDKGYSSDGEETAAPSE